jgi:phosphate-selective porin OprO/OprP
VGAATLVLGLVSLGPRPLAGQLRYDPLRAEVPEIPQLQVGDFTVVFGFYVQPQFQWVDAEGADSESSFRVRRARASIRGEAYDRFTYLFLVDMAGTSGRLVDGWIGTELHPLLVLTAGQAKAPFGRQQLTSDTGLQFVDRGILDPRFNPARQPGAWIGGASGNVSYQAGIYNGDGINQGNEDGQYLKAARVVWNPIGPFALEESALDYPEEPLLSLGVQALSNTFEGTDYTARRVGFEAAFKWQGINTVGEYVFERLDDSATDPSRDTHAWYLQAGYVVQPGYEVAGRYGTIEPDVNDDVTSDLTEKGIALSRYFNAHNMKIQADYLRIESEFDGTAFDQVRVQWQLRM